MKLVICSNHSYEHTGGTEITIAAIAEGLSKTYGYSSTILSRSVKNDMSHNGVTILRCMNDGKKFLEQLKNISPDNVFVYSDCFMFWPDILNNVEILPGRCSIALVGMNNMLSNRKLLSIFKRKHFFFRAITHSDNYQDYIICKDEGIPVHVIPNGVDAKEFVDTVDFRRKYGVQTKYMILCVSNFFPGKGQEYLLPVLDELYRKLPEFTAVFICTTVNFYVANNIRDRFRAQLKKVKFPNKLLSDIPREDVASAFVAADVFAFPSQKEVAPLVVLESMAAHTPWVALPVGNVPKIRGGRISPIRAKNSEGYAIFGKETHEYFVQWLYDILTNDVLREQLIHDGYEQIISDFTWNKIIPMYHQLFNQAQNGSSG